MEEEISLPENKGKSSAEELKEYASIPLKYKRIHGAIGLIVAIIWISLYSNVLRNIY